MEQYINSGESHGKYLIAVLEGMPSGLSVNTAFINQELECRQEGYGRGPRMDIEKDQIIITAGLLKGKTTGAPIGLMIVNKDVTIDLLPQLMRPRPGHADLAGALKYDQGIREVLERSSARETAMRVAVGAVCKQLLQKFDIHIISHVVRIGNVSLKRGDYSYEEVKKMTRGSRVHCISRAVEKKMIAEIDRAVKRSDTVGGEVEIIVTGVPIGLGSYVHHMRKLDALLAQSLMSIQAVKAVQCGLGVDYPTVSGSRAHDELFYSKQKGYYHTTNHAGGIEGGMSNGSDIVVRATMKPIATLKKPLRSVNVKTKKAQLASFERSDVCAVPSCGVIAESAVTFEIMRAFLEKCGGDSLKEITRNYNGYLKQIR